MTTGGKSALLGIVKLPAFNHSRVSDSHAQALLAFALFVRGNEAHKEATSEDGTILFRRWSKKQVPEGALLVDSQGQAQSPAAWVAGRAILLAFEAADNKYNELPWQQALREVIGLRARCYQGEGVQGKAVAAALALLSK